MKYMKLFVSLAALCLLAGLALATQNGNCPIAGTGNCNENCIKNCEYQGACNQQNCQAEENCQGQNCQIAGTEGAVGCQNKNGQNGNAQGARDGTGPLRDGCSRK